MFSIYFSSLADFEVNGHLCTPHEMLYTLRAFGQLNYCPPNSSSFFAAVESTLSRKLSEFDAGLLLELLSSFAYIQRFPINFASCIFSPHFILQLKGWSVKCFSLRYYFNFELCSTLASLLLCAPSWVKAQLSLLCINSQVKQLTKGCYFICD